jgi:hypothetical protein
MSVYLDKQTLSNAFYYLINCRENGIDNFEKIKVDEIRKYLENQTEKFNTDKFNEAELIYASESIKATFLVNKEYDLRRKTWDQIVKKSENGLPNSILLSFTRKIYEEATDCCKKDPNASCCTVKSKIFFNSYIEILSILRNNDVSALMVDRQDDSFSPFSLADRGDGSFGRAFGVNARRSFRVNARIAMSGDRDLEAEKEKIDIMWDSYKEYIIKFWEELE